MPARHLSGMGALRPDYGVPSIRIKAVCAAVHLGTTGDGPTTLLASRQWSAGLLEACTH
jgi:hypothetical protein